MSSTAVPAAPAIDEVLADLALQTRRLRIAAWAVGGAGLLVTAFVAGVRDDSAWVWRTVAAMAALATFFGYAVLTRPFWRQRRGQVLAPSGMPPGFATASSPLSHALTALLLAAAGFALGSGTPGAALALVLLAALTSFRPARIVVTPSTLLVRRIMTRSVPWNQLTGVRVTTSGGVAELSLAVDRPGRVPGTVRIRLATLDVDPAFLVHLVRHYLAVPEDRTAIGAPAELARRRAAYLVTGASGVDLLTDPGTRPVAALP